MVLAGLGLNPAGVSLFRMHAPQSPLTRNWFRLRLQSSRSRALILVVASSFVCGCIASSFCFFRPSERNVRQFYGAWFWQVWAWILLGFPCFGCVLHKALWRGIGFRLRLESSRFRALILVVASSFVCDYIASSFCFFRPSERNVRQFYGGWFWQVWAWILLGFPCFGCMPHRALWRGIGSAWGFSPRVLGPWSWWLHHLLFVVALHHLSVSLGRQNATLGPFTAHGFGRFGLESCWGSPVSDACSTRPFEEELASAWGLNPRVFGPWSWWLHHLLFVITLHHLSVSLGRQNATLGSFTGDGFGRFGLESCWGFLVSDACPAKPFWRGIGFRLRLESSRFRALILVVAASFVCGCIASSFCFFRPSERNVRQFYGGWFWQVWAWILLGFPCFGCVPHRALWRGIGFPLRLESSRFRALILVVASSFVCGYIASSFCFFRPAERNVRQFYGGWFWQVWAWILLGFPCFGCVPHKTLLTRNWLPLEAWILAFFGPWSWWLHHLLFVVTLHYLSVSSGRQNATLGSFTGDGFGRFGLESCWGFLVSDACHRAFDEELTRNWLPLEAWSLAFFGPWSWWLHHLLFVVTLH